MLEYQTVPLSTFRSGDVYPDRVHIYPIDRVMLEYQTVPLSTFRSGDVYPDRVHIYPIDRVLV
jgi:hypothetical protein